MTFHTQARTSGREIVRIVELVVPRCALRYGNQPCTAGARAVDHPNRFRQSEVFSGGDWTTINGGVTLTLSAFIAPNSTMTGVLMEDTSGAALRGLGITSNDISAVPASTYIHLSVHVLKAANQINPMVRIICSGSGTNVDAQLVIDKSTGVYSSTAEVFRPKVVDCGSWWRIGFSANKQQHTNLLAAMYPAAGSGSIVPTGAVAAVGTTAFWGALVQVNTTQMPPYLTRGVESQWLSTGLAQACYKTTATCQALSAYMQGEQSLFFIDENVDLPLGFEAFPALVRAQLTPSRLNPQAGVGDSAKLSLEFRDFSYDDRNTDAYVDARSYNANSQGTFFGRFFARDPYLQGKKVRYYEGYYAGSGTFTFSHYICREFIVDEIDRPDWKGRVRLRGTDLLRLTNGDRALCPVPSTATMQGNLTAVDTSVSLPSSAAAAYLVGEPHIRIDDEILLLVTQTGCRWTTVRGAGLTEAAVHSAGSVVQRCQTYSYTNVCSILMDQLVNFASIPSSYIPVNSWDAEKAATLTTYNLYNIVSTPTPVRDILNEVTRTCDLSIWYEEVAAKVALKHQSPWAVPSIALSDSASFISDTMTIRARDDLKVSRVGIRYAPTNYAAGTDYGRFQMAVNSAREDARFDGRKSEYIVETNWLSSSHDALAATIAGRAMLRYSELAPLEAQFQVDATTVASVRTGDVVELSTRLLQNVDGTMAATRMQVIEHGPEQAGHSYRYNALLYQGLAAATSLSIDVSTYNYNVHSALGGPASAVRVYLTVNSGVHVGGSGTNQAAITTSGLPSGSIVYLSAIGSSMVLGYAGAQGLGGTGHTDIDEDEGGWEFLIDNSGTPGSAGGTALYLADGVTAYIDVSAGYLFAGGPGGGGGGIDWGGGPGWTDGGNGGMGQGFTNSGGPSAPVTAGVVDGGSGAVWGGTAFAGTNGTYKNGTAAGSQGYAVKLASASAVYFFVGGYDSTHVKGLVGI